MKAKWETPSAGESNKNPEKNQDKNSSNPKKPAVPGFLLSQYIGGDAEQAKPAKETASKFDELLANLALKRKPEEANDTEATAEPIETPEHTDLETSVGEAEAQSAHVEQSTEFPDHVETAEMRESEPKYALMGGEVIYLRDDKPTVEAVDGTVEPPATSFDAPLYRPQFIQPHYERSQEATPEPAPEMAAGGGDVPPIQPPETLQGSFEEPPEPEPTPAASEAQPAVTSEAHQIEPAEAYRQYMERQATAQQQDGEQFATRNELDGAIRASNKSATRKAVVATLAAGVWGRHKRNQTERKTEKRFNTVDKKLNEARQSYNSSLEQYAQSQNDVQRRFESRIAAEHRETAQPQQVAEKPQQPNVEQMQPVQEGQLAVPENHFLRRDGWVVTEHEKGTGKLVEAPSFEYGEEYHRERAAETRAAQQFGTENGTATNAGQQGSGAAGDNAVPTQPYIPSATRQGAPPSDSKQASKLHQKATTNATKPTAALWPWLLALVVVVICLIAALH